MPTPQPLPNDHGFPMNLRETGIYVSPDRKAGRERESTMKDLREVAREEFCDDAVARRLNFAVEAAMDGNIEEAKREVAAAIGIRMLLCKQLDWINHPEKLETEVKKTRKGWRVTVKYRERKYVVIIKS